MSSSKALLAAAALGLTVGSAALAAEDLAALEVVGQRGQSVDQARRDRFECHNWAVEQTGELPAAVPPGGKQRDAEAERSVRRERVDRAIAGAAIGAGVGGLLGGGRRRDAADGVLGGAAVGAAIGAATAKSGRSAEAERDAEPSDYLRALSACLEGRGYSVRMPTTADFAANRSR